MGNKESAQETEQLTDMEHLALITSFTLTSGASREELLHLYGPTTMKDLIQHGLIYFVAPATRLIRGYRLTEKGREILQEIRGESSPTGKNQ